MIGPVAGFVTVSEELAFMSARNVGAPGSGGQHSYPAPER